MAGDRQTLISNEQVKLSATYLNGVAVALAAIGGISPLVGFAQDSRGAAALTITPACWVMSLVLHYGARRSLGRLVL
jgi:hypothetical protein